MLLMHWPVAFKHDKEMEILYHPNGKVRLPPCRPSRSAQASDKTTLAHH